MEKPLGKTLLALVLVVVSAMTIFSAMLGDHQAGLAQKTNVQAGLAQKTNVQATMVQDPEQVYGECLRHIELHDVYKGKKSLRDLWIGYSDGGDASELDVSVVVSFCHKDLSWLHEYLSGVSLRRLIIVSKCGSPPQKHELPDSAVVMELPNVGRIDHTMAFWMANKVDTRQGHYRENEVVVFLKDNAELHMIAKPRTFVEMLKLADATGFGCFYEPNEGLSQYHLTNALTLLNMTDYGGVSGKFDSSQFKSKYKNMKGWLDDMNIVLPRQLTKVCYGGMYAVKVSRIANVRQSIWERLEESLSRADNIEEGHFAERTWAALLSEPPTPEDANMLVDMADHINFRVAADGGGHLGALSMGY
jgi:hypothetical protein